VQELAVNRFHAHIYVGKIIMRISKMEFRINGDALNTLQGEDSLDLPGDDRHWHLCAE
jgi:hypothetical protein